MRVFLEKNVSCFLSWHAEKTRAGPDENIALDAALDLVLNPNPNGQYYTLRDFLRRNPTL